MGAKDAVEKRLESYNDVFADIVNVLVFNGRQEVQEDELEDALPRSLYKAQDGLHEQERDVAKYWKKCNIRIAYFGLENQTDVDYDMPLRVVAYDGAAYREQLLKNNKAKRRYPVITLVLYFGTKPWKGPKTLFERIDVPEELKGMVNDHKINLFEIAYLTREQVDMFKSDFRIIADHCYQTRNNPDYEPSQQKIDHLTELMQFMDAMTHDNRYSESARLLLEQQMKGGPVTMCDIMNRVEAKGVAVGEVKGKNLMARLALLLVQDGRTDEIERAGNDDAFYAQLLKEYGLVQNVPN